MQGLLDTMLWLKFFQIRIQRHQFALNVGRTKVFGWKETEIASGLNTTDTYLEACTHGSAARRVAQPCALLVFAWPSGFLGVRIFVLAWQRGFVHA